MRALQVLTGASLDFCAYGEAQMHPLQLLMIGPKLAPAFVRFRGLICSLGRSKDRFAQQWGQSFHFLLNGSSLERKRATISAFTMLVQALELLFPPRATQEQITGPHVTI